ncbi:uncharacterized protein LOC143027905 [Oratosquilla oratoria]|uniref:uncharacterized protein LOC143027905 n=1 Tax=Oratosquilla oratoria TaxID=337810 RepID=UPI003F75806A
MRGQLEVGDVEDDLEVFWAENPTRRPLRADQKLQTTTPESKQRLKIETGKVRGGGQRRVGSGEGEQPATLSETRRTGEGQLREKGGQYTFFWKSYDPEQQRIHGVGFAIRNAIFSKLTEQPIGICTRLMTLRIQLAKNEYATFIGAYAPTLNAKDVDKEAFYSQLDNAISAIHKDDKIILLGDFNTRVGKDHELWTGIIGKEGVGKANSNGTLLLAKCAEHNLVITNTFFRQKIRYKVSWQHPRSKHWHLIDYIIVRSSDQQDVLLTRALTGADECWTDHRLITSIMKIKLRPKVKHHGKADSEIYGPSTHGQAPLKSKDGTTILKSDTEIGDRWKEHFEDLLNHKDAINRNVLNMIPKEAKEDSLAQIPSLDDVRNAIKAMKNNKAAGPDGIPIEIYKFGGDLQEKCREQHQPLHMAFFDLSKAFDRISRELLWDVLATYGCPDKFIRILRLLHDNMLARVPLNNGNSSKPFKVTSGVKQGCVIAPTLFTIFIAAILHIIRDDLPPGIDISYRTDAALKEDHLQQVLNAFYHAYTKLGLSINIKKTQILYQPSPSTLRDHIPTIQLGGTSLENVNNFCYLGSHLSPNADLSDEIQHRLKSARTAFGKLRTRVFGDRDIQNDTKLMVYRAVVIPTLLHASETWTPYRHHLKTLENFHQRCLRKILNISWEDRRTNLSILQEAKTTSIEACTTKKQLRWSGHVVRMSDDRLPKQIFYSQLTDDKRTRGG